MNSQFCYLVGKKQIEICNPVLLESMYLSLTSFQLLLTSGDGFFFPL